MENDIEIEDTLLLELKQFNKKINFVKVIIGIIMFIIPSILLCNILELLGDWVTVILITISFVGLIYSIRVMNLTKILCRTHLFLLDCMINKKSIF
jgi:hypothetical protein